MKKIVFVALMVLCSASFGAGVITCEEGCEQRLTGDQLVRCLADCDAVAKVLKDGVTNETFNHPGYWSGHYWHPASLENEFFVKPQETKAPEYRLR